MGIFTIVVVGLGTRLGMAIVDRLGWLVLGFELVVAPMVAQLVDGI